MAFALTQLQLISTGGGIKVYSFKPPADLAAAIKAANYFAAASNILNVGDRIFVSDVTPLHYDLVVVSVTPGSPPDFSPPTPGLVGTLSSVAYA